MMFQRARNSVVEMISENKIANESHKWALAIDDSIAVVSPWREQVSARHD
jgi:hypothetical protein